MPRAQVPKRHNKCLNRTLLEVRNVCGILDTVLASYSVLRNDGLEVSLHNLPQTCRVETEQRKRSPISTNSLSGPAR